MVAELSHARDDLGVLAKEPDIRAELIYRWMREASVNLGTSLPGRGNKMMTGNKRRQPG
jgi:transposase-like protein